jgi:hypothetical protein
MTEQTMTEQAKIVEMELWKERDFCHKYMLTLAKRLDLKDVRKVPGKFAWAINYLITHSTVDNDENWKQLWKIRTALASAVKGEECMTPFGNTC